MNAPRHLDQLYLHPITSPNMLVTVPLEIQTIILELLSRQDLVAASRVCAVLNRVANDILYQDIHFSNTQPDLGHTFALLRVSSHLPSRVARATFTTEFLCTCVECSTEASWVPVSLLCKLARLRNLTLVGAPFPSVSAQRTFAEALRQHAPLLKALTFVRSRCKSHFPRLEPEDELSVAFNVGSLQQISWELTTSSEMEYQLLSLAKASSHTLTTLVINWSSAPSDASSCAATASKLFSLQFPNLKAFTYGSIPTTDADTTKMTTFLAKHPTLQSLTMDADITQMEQPFVSLVDDDILSSDSLPGLNFLRTHIWNILVLSKHGLLRHLEWLVVVEKDEDDETDGDMLFDNVVTNVGEHGLPRVEHLVYVTTPGQGSKDRLEQIARLCPNIKSWSSNFVDEFCNTYSWSIDYFKLFPSLETIDISREFFMCYEPAHPDDEWRKPYSFSSDEKVVTSPNSVPWYLLYNPEFDRQQQFRAASMRDRVLGDLVPSCPRIQCFRMHSQGWSPLVDI